MQLTTSQPVSTPVVETRGLSKQFHHPLFKWIVRARALSDLDLQIERGEVFGLLGPNGSGKSTTIKLILGLIFPSAGTISVFGRPPQDAAVKARLGYMPEESYLYRFLSAAETLDFHGRLCGLDRSERSRRTGALLELVGLAREKDRPIAEFSKGMQRRVTLAQALIGDPDLIILDEPTSGMDPIGTADIKELVRALRARGKTVLLCSHVLADVEEVCDRVTILYGGRERATGPLETLVRRGDLMSVTAPMEPETIEAVTALIRERQTGSIPVEVAPPLDSLERHFLDVVHQAQEEELDTSGARRFALANLDQLAAAPTPVSARQTRDSRPEDEPRPNEGEPTS